MVFMFLFCVVITLLSAWGIFDYLERHGAKWSQMATCVLLMFVGMFGAVVSLAKALE